MPLLPVYQQIPNVVCTYAYSDTPDVLYCIGIDHTVELQVLDFVAKQAKLCEVLTAMANAGQKKDSLLAPASETISGIQNLNFLNKVVNNNVNI